MPKNPHEKVLIVGGSSGIGLATAQMAASQHYEVIIASRSQEKLERAKAEIDHPVSIIQVDMCDHHSVTNLFKTTGPIDHVVITASDIHYGNIRNTEVVVAKQSFGSKFFGPYALIKEALNFLSPQGTITLFSGTVGTKPKQGTEILAAINAAVEGFARGLATSLAPIRVNCIAPGIIDTPVYDHMDEHARLLFKQFINKLLIKRIGEAKEVALAVMYLIQNTYVTGTTLYVDGGNVIS